MTGVVRNFNTGSGSVALYINAKVSPSSTFDLELDCALGEMYDRIGNVPPTHSGDSGNSIEYITLPFSVVDYLPKFSIHPEGAIGLYKNQTTNSSTTTTNASIGKSVTVRRYDIPSILIGFNRSSHPYLRYLCWVTDDCVYIAMLSVHGWTYVEITRYNIYTRSISNATCAMHVGSFNHGSSSTTTVLSTYTSLQANAGEYLESLLSFNTESSLDATITLPAPSNTVTKFRFIGVGDEDIRINGSQSLTVSNDVATSQYSITSVAPVYVTRIEYTVTSVNDEKTVAVKFDGRGFSDGYDGVKLSYLQSAGTLYGETDAIEDFEVSISPVEIRERRPLSHADYTRATQFTYTDRFEPVTSVYKTADYGLNNIARATTYTMTDALSGTGGADI